MKLREIKDQIDRFVEMNPEVLDYEVFIEDEDLYTIGQKTLARNDFNPELIEHNRNAIHKIKSAQKSGWKFLTVENDDFTDYYKECAGGLGMITDKHAVTIHINY